MGAFFATWGALLGVFIAIVFYKAYGPKFNRRSLDRRDRVCFHIYRNRAERIGRFLAKHYGLISLIALVIFCLFVTFLCIVVGGAFTSMD